MTYRCKRTLWNAYASGERWVLVEQFISNGYTFHKIRRIPDGKTLTITPHALSLCFSPV